MSEIVRLDPKEEQLDNTIYPVDQGLYIADNGSIISEFYQVDNEVVVNSKGRRISWSPYDMRYIDEFGMEDPVFTVQEVPLETKANYARYNRAMPDVDDWFIQENDRLKHQILIQGFQPDPSPWMFGKLDFAIGGKMRFDSDLRIVADGAEHVNPFETHGAIQLYDGEELIFELPQVVAFDSAYDRAMTFGKYRVWFDDNGEMMFDIIVDYGWMTAPERIYPVVIDPTIIVQSGLQLNQASGRFGTKLTNGWMVTAIFNNTDKSLEFYKSSDEGTTWTILYEHAFGLMQNAPYYSMSNKGDIVFLLMTHNKTWDGSAYKHFVELISFDAANPVGTFQKYNLTPSPSAGINQGCSLLIENNNIHMAFTAYYGSTANASDIYYVKGTIEANNSITVNRTDKVTVAISSENASDPTLIFTNATLKVVYLEVTTTGSRSIRMMTFNGSSWANEMVVASTSGINYVGASYDLLGRMYISYLNASNKAVVVYSDDGINFASVTVADSTKRPSISADYNNKIYLTVNNNGFKQYVSEDRGVTWSAARDLGAGTGVPNMTFDLSSGIIGTILEVGSGTINFDAVFLNRSPDAPSNLVRSNFDSTESTLFAWNYSDPDPNDPQSAYQLQIVDITEGATVFDSNKTPSLNSSHNLLASTLSNNKQYQWRVKTWDNEDSEGPWSDYATFYTSAKPALAITNLTDGQIYPINTLTLEWTMSDPESEGQSAYQAKILSNSDAVLFDTGKVIDARSRARTLNYELLNGQSYKIALTVWDAKDVKSNEQVLTINVDYTEPAVPLLTTSTDATRGTITVHIEHPTPVFPEPTVINTDIYRRKLGETAWERIEIGVDPAFIDYTPASEQVYEYKVRGWGDNQIYTDSDIISDSVKLQSSQLALVSDYSKLVHMKYDPSRSQTESRDRVVSHFAGRRDPVAEFGDNRNNELSMSFVLNEKADLDLLRTIVDAGQTLLYRDNRGRKMFCSVGNIQIVDEQALYYKVSVPMTRVSHTEEV